MNETLFREKYSFVTDKLNAFGRAAEMETLASTCKILINN